MQTSRFCLSLPLMAALACGIGPVSAEPLAVALPPHSITTLPAASLLGSPLLGKWHDGPCLLLPPGITPFETVSDTLAFHADGTFTQTIEKATGRLQTRGSYSVAGSRVTLSFLFGTSSLQYGFFRIGNQLQLQPVGPGKIVVRTLSRVGTDT